MLPHHKSHLFSTYTTVLQHLSDVRQAAGGKSPTGEPLVPLPADERKQLIPALDAIGARLGEVISQFAGEHARFALKGGGVSVTRMWVSILLRTVEELIADLQPARMQRRYGGMERSEATELHEHVEELLSLIRDTIDTSAPGNRTGRQ